MRKENNNKGHFSFLGVCSGATERNFAIFSLFFDLSIFCPILTCLPNLVSF